MNGCELCWSSDFGWFAMALGRGLIWLGALDGCGHLWAPYAGGSSVPFIMVRVDRGIPMTEGTEPCGHCVG